MAPPRDVMPAENEEDEGTIAVDMSPLEVSSTPSDSSSATDKTTGDGDNCECIIISEGGKAEKLMGENKPPCARCQGRHTARDIIHDIDAYFHRIPRWKYRLLIGVIVYLLVSLVILSIAAVLYGFSLTTARVDISQIALANPPATLLDPDGGLPINVGVRIFNPNSFGVSVRDMTIDVFLDPNRQVQLLSTNLQRVSIQPKGDTEILFRVPIYRFNEIKGSDELATHALLGGYHMFWATAVLNVRILGFGFLPLTRKYEEQCKVARKFGEGEFVVSDCFGQFKG